MSEIKAPAPPQPSQVQTPLNQNIPAQRPNT